MTSGVIKTQREAASKIRYQKLPLKTIRGQPMQVHNTILIIPAITHKMQPNPILQYLPTYYKLCGYILFLQFQMGVLGGEWSCMVNVVLIYRLKL